jgi:REP element-mobilizing transposase RayT
MNHKMTRRCHDHDYRAPAFYMVTIVAHRRRPWFAVCENNTATLTEDGRLVRDLWRRITVDYPGIEATSLCIMPDHLHGVLRIHESLSQHMGVAIRAFKSQATSAMRKKYTDPQLTLWEPGYNDKCVWRDGSLRAYTKYIQDNPRRYCLKKANPDLFRRIEHLQHAALPGEKDWTGYGNLFLLDRPEMRDIRVSRKATEAQVAALREDVLREAARGTVFVSPFISQGEKDVALAILDAPKGDVILLKHDGFPPLFKPKGRYFDLCVAGRLLILSCGNGGDELTRDRCLEMNGWCEQIAENNDTAENGDNKTFDDKT